MRAKLWLLSSVLVLGLAACGDDAEQGAEVEVPPPAVESEVAEPVVVEPTEEPATAGTEVVVPETEPEVAGPTGTVEPQATEGGTVTTYGGEAGPTVVAPGGEAGATGTTDDPVMDRANTPDGTAGGSPGGGG